MRRFSNRSLNRTVLVLDTKTDEVTSMTLREYALMVREELGLEDVKAYKPAVAQHSSLLESLADIEELRFIYADNIEDMLSLYKFGEGLSDSTKLSQIIACLLGTSPAPAQMVNKWLFGG